MNLIINLKRAILIVSLFLPIVLNASTWIYQYKNKETNEKELLIKKGNYPNGKQIESFNDSEIFIRDMDNSVTRTNVINGKIPFDVPYKGSYHIFFKNLYLEDEVLNIELSSIRIYNVYGDLKDALVKEVRGKTVGTHYAKEPLSEIPFEVILQKPIRKHHINCCLYSGDILPFKIYFKSNIKKDIPLRVYTQKGWTNKINPDSDGIVSFEIPRNTYADIKTNKRYKESLLVEASYEENISGIYNGKEYKKRVYTMTLPFDFHTSPLEYSSQLSGFYVVVGVMLVFSLGIYYYRRKKKKEPKEIWFDEK